MRVDIGPYKNWFGPYQLARTIEKIIGPERADRLGDWLADTWVRRFLEWVDSKKNRRVVIHIDHYDTWSTDETLAHIIHPLLVELKKYKNGSPLVDDSDVPDNLKSINSIAGEQEWDLDSNHHNRWDWVLDEMIWTFDRHRSDQWEDQFNSGVMDYFIDDKGYIQNGPNHTFEVDTVGLQKHRERMNNGRRLFAKYYESLWV